MIKKRKKGPLTPNSLIFPGLAYGPKVNIGILKCSLNRSNFSLYWDFFNEFKKKSLRIKIFLGRFEFRPPWAVRVNALSTGRNSNSIKKAVVLNGINSPPGQFLLLKGHSIG